MIAGLKLFTYNTFVIFFPANFIFSKEHLVARTTFTYDNEEPASRQSQNNGAVADLLHVHRPASPITLESEMPHAHTFWACTSHCHTQMWTHTKSTTECGECAQLSGPRRGCVKKRRCSDMYKSGDSMAQPRDSSATSQANLEPVPQSLCHMVVPYIHGGYEWISSFCT